MNEAEAVIAVPATWETTPADYTAVVELDRQLLLENTIRNSRKPEWNCAIYLLAIRDENDLHIRPYLMSGQTAADVFDCN